MKRILALFLIVTMLLSVLASCTEDPKDPSDSTAAESGETQGGTTDGATKEPQDTTVQPPVLTESDLDVDLSAFGADFDLYKALDFGEIGAGALSANEGVWELVNHEDGSVSLKAQRADGGSQYQSGKWTFTEAQNWSGCEGILFYVDFSAANTSNFHGATIRLYTELNGIPLALQPGEEMTAYSSADGKTWVERHVNEGDAELMHTEVDKKFVGYIYIPFSQYEGLTSLDALTAVEFDVCRVTSGETVIKDVTLVSIDEPYETPELGETVEPGSVQSLDFSKLVENAEIVTVTNFNDVGAGTTANVPETTTLTQTLEKYLTFTRNGGDWYQTADWVFAEAQNWTGMAGVLVKVDFTGANTNSDTGGHGVSIGVHTTALGETVALNDPTLGGYAYNLQKDTWQSMVACKKYANLLVVDPNVYTRYDGYVYIPISAFGEAGISGLDSVTSLTLYIGANTSKTAVVEGIWLIKGTELFPVEEEEPVVERDNDGTPIVPATVTSPVDLTGVVSDATVSQITDFHSVGTGSVTNQVGDIQVINDRINVVRTGGWYDSFDWIFTNSQNWADAAGILVKVDFTSANTDATNGFHGIGFSIYTKALGDEGAAKLEPAKGGYLNASGIWEAMEVSTADPTYLDGGKRYSGYIFIPFSSFDGLTGLDHVTGFNMQVGAITSGTAYVDGVYLVKGTVEVVNQLEAWLQDSKAEQNHTVLEGITINALGDSYFAGNGLNQAYVWPQLLATKYNALLNNYGKNGSTVTNYITTKNPMCERYTQMTTSANIILIEGGRNDYNNAVPIGTVDSYDTTTFMGALNTIVKGVREANPNAMIVLVTNWKFGGTHSTSGLTYADYANAMLAVAEAQGVYSINASDPNVVGVDMSNAEFRAQYSMSATDVSHLNLQGMMYVMPKFEAILAQYYTEFLAEHEPVESTTQTVQTTWSKGYVGSSTNTNWAGKINTGANSYSYSDIIIVEKAGTTLTFSDTASGYASASAYVISFWKKVDGEWVIDTEHEQYAGAGGNGSSVEGKSGDTVTYTYTTQSDNECIRLCYRSEQTDDFTPEFPTVTLTLTEN